MNNHNSVPVNMDTKSDLLPKEYIIWFLKLDLILSYQYGKSLTVLILMKIDNFTFRANKTQTQFQSKTDKHCDISHCWFG